MRLPEELETSFWDEVTEYEENKKMPYVTSVEQRGIKQGILKGIEALLEVKFGAQDLRTFTRNFSNTRCGCIRGDSNWN